jgi:uncharacterized membrane protein YbaN (DUF454 family)
MNTSLHPITRTLLIIAGIVSLALGIIGIPIPLLPTTPFLLLSAFLFGRSSVKLYNWLINHRYFGPFIRDYREKRGVNLKIKIGSITILWITILYSVFFCSKHTLDQDFVGFNWNRSNNASALPKNEEIKAVQFL